MARHVPAGTAAARDHPRPGGEMRRDRGRLGPFLCWGVVFADIGTSVYYTPGILFQQPGIGTHAALFVALTLLVFVLLTVKYGEVAVRYPGGGGVVTVATHALHPFAGLLGGMFILVDYFLTAALSALSGLIYLSDVAPALRPVVLPAALLALGVLGVLNLIGISTSAKVNVTVAVLAAASQLAVVLAVIVQVGPAQLLAALPRVLSGPRLTPLRVLTGYAGAFLAFSGLESISQLSPAIAEPRRRVVQGALRALVATMALTSPLLTLWSTTVLPITTTTDPNQFISLLAGYAAGHPLEIEVAVSGALLLVFASNTALIGSYHVFLALARRGFLPPVLMQRNRMRNTPHWAILAAVGVPLVVLVLAHGSVTMLGDLYAFGLLGAFSLTCLGLDIVRWHERHPGQHPRGEIRQHEQDAAGAAGAGGGPVGRGTFALGVLTTGLVTLAWTTNLFAKPLATLFGGAVTCGGLLIGLATYALEHRRGRPRVFPLLYHPEYPSVFLARGRRARQPATVLAVLPRQAAQVGALVGAAHAAAAGGPVVFVQRGTHDPTTRPPRLFEIVEPHLEDP
ncbi:MAG TPA: APC family permease, partial [Chloroflexota bacterium]|nr:APC family permease [Chloroflexota bacterium]